MPWTDTAVRQAKLTGKDYTLKDTTGLALFVGAKGAKQWHFRGVSFSQHSIAPPEPAGQQGTFRV